MSGGAITNEILRHALRSELPSIVLAAILLAAGIASITLWRLRSRDPLLLWLGLFTCLYGMRLFIDNDLVRMASGADTHALRNAIALITYCIPIPFGLFFRELLGAGWKGSITAWVRVQIVFAPLAIGTGILSDHARLTNLSNNLLIIAGALLVLVHLLWRYSPDRGARVMNAGIVSFLASALLTNLGLRFGTHDIEPAGFLILICALGYTAAHRATVREEKLTEVEHELSIAQRIQSTILPRRPPEVIGLAIATRYSPMTAVAGDFYDFLVVDDRRLTILVADVSGHGVPAALIASMLKVGVAAQRHNAANPAEILTGLNSMLSGILDGQFVTAACAFIDLEAKVVTYAGAGHPPALLARRCGDAVVELAENGLFLGPFPRASYTNLVTPFERGDKLLLYTDGIVEATIHDGQPFGDERLREFLRKRHTTGASALADELIRAVSAPVQEDDLTVVVAEAT